MTLKNMLYTWTDLSSLVMPKSSRLSGGKASLGLPVLWIPGVSFMWLSTPLSGPFCTNSCIQDISSLLWVKDPEHFIYFYCCLQQ